jgi:excinuclease ABC subunit C
VLLRDDKSFPYILVTGDHEAPAIFKHRGARKRKGDYFGPFASAGAVGRTINALQRAFLMRTCSDSVYEKPHPALPALPDQALRRALHRRDRCRGLCGLVGGQGVPVRAAASREGATGQPRCRRPRRISISSAPPSIATACRRCRHVQSHQGINPQSVEEADVFAIHQDGGRPASRCSSSAPARTGATAPISRRPTRRWSPARSWRFIGTVLRRQADAAA